MFGQQINSEDSSEAGVDKSLDSLHGGHSCLPGFWSIKQNWLHHRVEDPDDVNGQI